MTRVRTAVLVASGLLVAVAAVLAWLPRRGYFWPRWAWFALGAVGVAALLVQRVRRTPAGRRRWLVADGALLVFLTPVEVAVWLLSGRGFFWPVYSLVTLSVMFGAHVFYIARRPDSREAELTRRVDTLTRTRRGAVDYQAAELRRIERDLHDGAQARMVSVALSIGIAKTMIGTDPAEAARLLDDARTAAGGALEDLRGVMHGMYPAVLSDRGLGGGVRALVADLVIPVQVDGDPPAGLPAATEAAVYFAAAECLANAVKHGRANSGWIRFDVTNGALVVQVGDDGVGGARLDRGSGLRGIVDRLAVLDGTLDVNSPPGGPTRMTIRVPVEGGPGA